VAAPAAPNVAAGRERTASSAARPANAGWYPRFDRADTLDGVLDASTPLLSRAFRNVRAV
jgi:hypothetical protein